MERAIALFRKEKGRLGNLEISGKLVRLDPLGEALIIGDLHGDLECLKEILVDSCIIQKMTDDKNSVLIFLGDYGDRGSQSVEIYYTILNIKLAFPEQTILLRGNHEGPVDFLAYPHDLPKQLEFKFKEKWTEAHARILELFDCLYNAVFVEERYLMVHGGLSMRIASTADLALPYKGRDGRDFLEDLLWSDPDDVIQGSHPSPRGAGELFGKNVTETVLNRLGVQILIRGHEPAEEGFKINHAGKILTLFSRKGAPYFNSYGAYLDLPLSKKFERADQLLPWIHQF